MWDLSWAHGGRGWAGIPLEMISAKKPERLLGTCDWHTGSMQMGRVSDATLFSGSHEVGVKIL